MFGLGTDKDEDSTVRNNLYSVSNTSFANVHSTKDAIAVVETLKNLVQSQTHGTANVYTKQPLHNPEHNNEISILPFSLTELTMVEIKSDPTVTDLDSVYRVVDQTEDVNHYEKVDIKDDGKLECYNKLDKKSERLANVSVESDHNYMISHKYYDVDEDTNVKRTTYNNNWRLEEIEP
jgi:RNA binding exosome subunit